MSFLKILTDYKQFQIFVLGIFSGMPLTIIYATLSGWLKSQNVDIAIITTFAVARIFYSLKFLWAFLLDYSEVPVISRIGRRKSWMCVMSIAIASVMFCYTLFDASSMNIIYILTLLLGFSSASLDIVIDAFRIDTIPQDLQSIAAANAVFGYLFGGLIAGAGVLYISEDYGWNYGFLMISILYLVFIVFILTLKEPKLVVSKIITPSKSRINIIITPFIDFFKRDQSVLILTAIVFYKLGEAMLGVIAMPFYMKLHFTMKEIALGVKIFGLSALIIGSYLGGFIMRKHGNLRGMIICGIAQSITNISFIWLNYMGHNINALLATISIENIGSGMGNAALVGYLSYLCDKKFSASQYALLSSASGLFSHTIVVYAGSLVKLIGWDSYFLATIFFALPGLALLIYLDRRSTVNNSIDKNFQ